MDNMFDQSIYSQPAQFDLVRHKLYTVETKVTWLVVDGCNSRWVLSFKHIICFKKQVLIR